METKEEKIQENVPDDDFPTDVQYTSPSDVYGDFADRTPTIFERLVSLMKEVGVVPKDKVNEFQHYKYASASATMEKIQDGLKKLGLCVTEMMDIERVDEVQTKERTVQNYIVRCTLRVYDMNSGDSVTSSAFGSGMDTGDKGIMKAQTAARKYAWWGLLVVGTPDDPEADTATDSITSKTIEQPKPSADNVTMATILEIKQEAPNRPFEFNTSEGVFKTFDKNLAQSAELARATGLQMEIHWRPNPNPKYNDRIAFAPKKIGG